jgi:hypothetical protein
MSSTGRVPYRTRDASSAWIYKTQFRYGLYATGGCGNFTQVYDYWGGSKTVGTKAVSAGYCASYEGGTSPEFDTTHAATFDLGIPVPPLGITMSGGTAGIPPAISPTAWDRIATRSAVEAALLEITLDTWFSAILKPAISNARRRIAILVAAVLLAALIAYLVAAPSSPAVNTGPLGDGGTSGGICVPIRPGAVESWGITYLGNTGRSDAIIEKISLVRPRNLRLAASYVVPITGLTEYGSWFGYPPAPPQRGVQWSRHTLAAGTHLPPARGRDHADLVTVLQPTGPVAEAQAINVFYLESGTRYQMQTHYRFVLLVGQKSCPVNWPRKYPA